MLSHARSPGREQEPESHLWGEMRQLFFYKCNYEFLKEPYLSNELM